MRKQQHAIDYYDSPVIDNLYAIIQYVRSVRKFYQSTYIDYNFISLDTVASSRENRFPFLLQIRQPYFKIARESNEDNTNDL